MLTCHFQPVSNILGNGHWQRHGAREDDPDPAPQPGDIQLRVENILFFEADAAFHFLDVRQIVKTIDRPKQGGFASSRRAEEDIDGVFLNAQAYRPKALRAICVCNTEIVDLDDIHSHYHCRFARARERMIVATTFIIKTNESITSTVAY
jgi:hypothetical protein